MDFKTCIDCGELSDQIEDGVCDQCREWGRHFDMLEDRAVDSANGIDW